MKNALDKSDPNADLGLDQAVVAPEVKDMDPNDAKTHAAYDSLIKAGLMNPDGTWVD